MSRVHGDMASSFKDAEGNLVEYFKGQVVADEHVALLDSWGALVRPGEESMSLEERMERELGIEREDTPLPLEHVVAVSPDVVRITGDYESKEHTADHLATEASMRGLTVDGTGAGGNVLRGDLEKALAADDEKAASG